MASKATSEALAGYWQEQVDKWRVSEQSQQAFCKAHDLNYHRFMYWRRKFDSRSTKKRSTPSPALVPVTYRPPATVAGLTLVLPSGLELHGLSKDNLSLVQQLLARLS